MVVIALSGLTNRVQHRFIRLQEYSLKKKKKKTHDENANSAQRPIQMRQLNTCGTSNAQSLPFMQTEVSS